MSDLILDELLEKAKKTTTDLLTIAGFTDLRTEIKIDPIEKSFICLSVHSSQDVSFLIGRGGGVLNDLQTVLNVIFKNQGIGPFILVDINDYRKERILYLKDIAVRIARKVDQTKQAEALDPMPFYERKIIHSELSSRPDVITESQDRGPDRHVVIKPYIFTL